MRALVTGAAGFAGRHLVALLRARRHDVVAAGHGAEASVDFRIAEHVADLVEDARPDVVFHLAGTSSAVEMARDPAGGNANVVQPAVNVLEAVAFRAPAARVLLASGHHVYGRPGRLPVDEACPMQPTDLFGAAKAAVEYMTRTYRERGVHVVIARAFDHTGPGQDRRSPVADWAARAAAGEARIPVGDLGLRRDVSDVRDVVAGYLLIAERGEPGQAYNLCSGRAVALRDLFALCAPGAEPVEDPSLARRGEPTALLGSAARAEALGWARRHPLEVTIADLRASVGA